jgi:putative salt-induced outer membrane protein YdiY
MKTPKFLNRILKTRFAVALTALVSGTAALAADAAAPVIQTNSPWEGLASVGLTVTRGNSENILFTAAAKMARKGPLNEISFGADAAYGESTTTSKRDPITLQKTETTTKNANLMHGFFQYNRIFDEQVYGYVRLDALHDDIADISYRISLSPGVGHYFIKKPNTRLSLEVGPGVILQRTSGADPNTDVYATLRVAERFEHKFNDSVKMWQTLEFLPQVDRFGNYLINFEIGAEAALNKTFSLLTYLQDNYDNEPAAGRKNNDLKLVAALGAKF